MKKIGPGGGGRGSEWLSPARSATGDLLLRRWLLNFFCDFFYVSRLLLSPPTPGFGVTTGWTGFGFSSTVKTK